jgi:hypothetical protein
MEFEGLPILTLDNRLRRVIGRTRQPGEMATSQQWTAIWVGHSDGSDTVISLQNFRTQTGIESWFFNLLHSLVITLAVLLGSWNGNTVNLAWTALGDRIRKVMQTDEDGTGRNTTNPNVLSAVYT